MPFQPGNKHGGRNDRPWRNAIKVAMAADDGRALRELAEKLKQMALAGDMQAIQEIGNRLDGKPRQEVDANVVHGLSERFLDVLRQANGAPQIEDRLSSAGHDTVDAVALESDDQLGG